MSKVKYAVAMSVLLAVMMLCMPSVSAAPTVSSTSPVDGAVDVAVDTVIHVHFSQVMDTSTVEDATSISPVVAMTFDWDANEDTLFITAALKTGVTYTVTITNDAENSTGTAMVHDYDFSFTTVASPVLTAQDQTTAFVSANWMFILLLLVVVVLVIYFAYSSKTTKRKK